MAEARGRDERERTLRAWVAQVLAERVPAGGAPPELAPLAGDASFRRYFRARAGRRSWVAMDAPPPREDVATFCLVARRLSRAGLNVPRVLAEDRARGFLLLEDLGDRLLLHELEPASADAFYGAAIEAIVRMQQRVDTAGLPDYGETLLLAEMRLFPDWFVVRHLGVTLAASQRRVLHDAFALLVEAAREQPQAFVHRDYHSRNLMVCSGRTPGILDFQDAVRGPLTYDLVSLLRDVYVRWPAVRIDRWIDEYLARAEAAGLVEPRQRAVFRHGLDLMGVQRHLKIAGIFCRLHYRDGKSAYLEDLPLTLAYLQEVLPRYPELSDLAGLVAELVPRLPRGPAGRARCER